MSKSNEIQEYILGKIKNNEYKVGEQIPTENELMKLFGVSRMTVNKALNELREKKYITSVRGKGTFVSYGSFNKRLNELTSFTEEMKMKGIVPFTKTLEYSYTYTGYEEEKISLGLDKDESIYKLVRLRFCNGRPIALDVTILNPKVTGEIDFNKMGTSLFAYLENELNIKISYAVQKIKAIKADASLANKLEIPVGDPVLKISGITYDESNNPIELVHTYYVHDAYEFEQVSRK